MTPSCPECGSDDVTKVAFTYRSDIKGVNQNDSGPINNVYECQECEEEFEVPYPGKVLNAPIHIANDVYVLPVTL